MSRIHRPWHARIVVLALAAAPVMLDSVSHAAPQDLLVSSRLTDQLLRYDGRTGVFLGAFVTAGGGGLDVPFGMDFGPDGNLYVAGGGLAPRIKRYDGATGDFLDDFTQEFPELVGFIAFQPDGNLYGVHGSVVFRVDGATGAFVDDFVDLGLSEFATSFSFGPDGNVGKIAFGPDGNLYVGLPNTGNDILRFDGSAGASLGSFIPAPDPHPDGPLAFVFGPDGNLYVPSRNTEEVLRYDGTTGAFIDVLASGGGLDEPAALVFFAPGPGQVLLLGTGALVLAAAHRRRAARSWIVPSALGLAVAAGSPAARAADRDLLVTSRVTSSVLRFDGVTGEFVGEFVSSGSGGLEAAFGMTFGPDGNLYVSEGNPPAGGTNSDPRVHRYDGSTGAFIDHFTPVFAEPIRTIVFGPDGDLYGNTGGTVLKADGATGAFIDTFVDLGLGEATSGLTFGPDGNLYVSSYLANQVMRFDATTGLPIGDGVFAEVPISGPAGHPAGLTFGPDGDLYVALRDGADVWRFDGATGDSLGSFIPAADIHPDVPSSPIFGLDGNLYVASQGSDQVLRYDGTSGGFIDVFASGGDLDEPVALVFVPEPGQLVLVATGALLLAAVGRRRAP